MRTIPAIILLVSSLSAAAVTYLPRTSEKQMDADPQLPGEVSYAVESSSGATELYIGGQRMTDSAALRGYRLYAVPQEDLAVSKDDAVIETNGLYKLTSAVTGRVYVAVTSGRAIKDVNFAKNSWFASGSIPPMTEASASVSISGNSATITLVKSSGWLGVSVSNIVVTALRSVDRITTNDLTSTTILIKDRLGQYDMNDARYWAKHSNDGNLGQDWSRYAASSEVSHGSYYSAFAVSNAWAAGAAADTFIISDDRIAAVRVTTATNDGTAAGITVTLSDIDQASQTVNVTFGGTAAIHPALIALAATDNLNGGSFRPLKCSAVLISGRTYRVAYSDPGFQTVLIRAEYDAFWRSRSVTVAGHLRLIGDDGVLYRISVSNSVISAQAIQ